MELTTNSGATVSVSEVAFGREYNESLVHQVVTAYLSTGRQGTKAQKNRAAVSLGVKKVLAELVPVHLVVLSGAKVVLHSPLAHVASSKKLTRRCIAQRCRAFFLN